MDRKLAAIMAIDVVGFAGRMARDETGTLANLERLKQDVLELQVDAHRGRIFKFLGDGALAEFTSTVEAVNCAIGIQKTQARQAARSGDPDRLQLRIGVSVGDVVVQGDDLLGDGVNTAARLEAMADPDGIAISGDVMAQIRGKVDMPFDEAGLKKLKQSDEPIRVFKTGGGSAQPGGLFDFDDTATPDQLITGSCLCGQVRFEIDMPHISTGYCHCRICQKFTGSAMSVWTAFPARSVRFVGAEPHYFKSSPIAERGFCKDCGSSLTYRLVRPQKAAFLVLFTACLDHPEDFAPGVHGGMESKMPWLEIFDELPRSTCAESRSLQQAWESVGLDDPQQWGPDSSSTDLF